MRFSRKKHQDPSNTSPIPNIDLKSEFDYSVENFLKSLDLLKDSFNLNMDRADYLKELSAEDLAKMPGAKLLTAIWFTKWLEAQTTILKSDWFNYDEKMMHALGSFFISLEKNIDRTSTLADSAHFPHKTQEEATLQFLPDDQDFSTVSHEEFFLYVYPLQELLFTQREELARFILRRNLVRSMPYPFELGSMKTFLWGFGVKGVDGLLAEIVAPVLLELEEEVRIQPSDANSSLRSATQILSAKMLLEWWINPTRMSIGSGQMEIK